MSAPDAPRSHTIAATVASQTANATTPLPSTPNRRAMIMLLLKAPSVVHSPATRFSPELRAKVFDIYAMRPMARSSGEEKIVMYPAAHHFNRMDASWFRQDYFPAGE